MVCEEFRLVKLDQLNLIELNELDELDDEYEYEWHISLT